MTLQGYLARLADTLHSRHDITLEELRLTLTTVGAIFQASARFYDESRLLMVEEVERISSRDVRRVAYKFHYQQADGTLLFRYDDSPHHPHLSTFPHHKHAGSSVIETGAPDMADVLREIDALIYTLPDTEQPDHR
ncbi:MAG: hypothetical protein CVU38_14640 [Chloroflexi bacterium HGW-Chloroflexi-1]|nr:MAG: hypothetical protein CVU38_14640 [Chloroflexi bacterium HGW-Chloroflexi-1]